MSMRAGRLLHEGALKELLFTHPIKALNFIVQDAENKIYVIHMKYPYRRTFVYYKSLF